MRTTLPFPTESDLVAQDHLAQFGYCILSGVLPSGEVQRLRKLVLAAAAEERGQGQEWISNGNQKVFMLLNLDDVFLDLVLQPRAMKFARNLLDSEPLLSSVTANITRPGNALQALHADQQYVREPWHYAAALNIIWALDDFTEKNGATVVVPGSHKIGAPPDTQRLPEVSAIAPRGSMIVIDGRTWHGSGENSTASETRAAILAHYCVPWLRQQENLFRSMQPAVRARLTPHLRTLLGFDVWSGLGVVNGFPREWQGRASRTGPTNADGIFPA
jgi:hypothetical protein